MAVLADVDLADPDLYEHGDPDAVWAWLREHAPVHRNTGAARFWSVTRHRDAVAVYRDPVTFSSARGMVLGVDVEAGDPASGRMLVVTDPPRHTGLRKIVNGVFTPRMLRRLESRVATTVEQLVDRVVGGECEFVNDVAARLPVTIICELLGVPGADQDWMYHLTSTAFGGGDPRSTADVAPADRAQAYGDIFDYYRDLAEQRRRSPGSDLVSILVQGDVDGAPLDTEDVLLNCTNLIIGGNETTRHAAAGGLLAFAERPATWQALRQAGGAVDALVEEVLRWTTPGMHVLRTATRDVEIGGVPIAAGDSVVVWNASANRDDEIFREPQRFDPNRSPNRHIAFGQGGHHCLGAALARIELTTLFGALLARVGRVELAGPVVRVRSCVLRG
ncbi:MAG TPA: cytochrome P450, partial [Pseudonocardiaceae bacterium]